MQDQALALMPYEVGHMAQQLERLSGDIAEAPDLNPTDNVVGWLFEGYWAGAVAQNARGGFLAAQERVRDEAAASPEPEGRMLAECLDAAVAMTNVASSQIRALMEFLLNVLRTVTSVDDTMSRLIASTN